MTTPNDDATTRFPTTDETTPLTSPTFETDFTQESTTDMPIGVSSNDPFASFSMPVTTPMPSAPFRSHEHASDPSGTKAQEGASPQDGPAATPLGQGARTAFDPAFTGESPSSARGEADASARFQAAQSTGMPRSAPGGYVDLRALPEAPSRGVRIGAFVWAILVCMIGCFLISEAFISSVNLPVLEIGAIAALGGILIVTAIFSGHSTASKNRPASRGSSSAADAIQRD